MADSADGIEAIPPPRSPVYRVGRAPNPFVAPSWAFVGPDGTFGGRFDDPRGRQGLRPARRFRVLYFATHDRSASAAALERRDVLESIAATIPITAIYKGVAP